MDDKKQNAGGLTRADRRNQKRDESSELTTLDSTTDSADLQQLLRQARRKMIAALRAGDVTTAKKHARILACLRRIEAGDDH